MAVGDYISEILTTDGSKHPIGSSVWVSSGSWNGKTKTEVENEIKTKFSNLTEITWSSLKSLVSTGTLIPGMKYRITDYNCTTTQDFTRSAGHQFDIIVEALDNNTLSENASAINHSVSNGETDYFADCDLNAWKIWYCLDNDKTRFAWADDTKTNNKENGRGVIYRMIDEFGNDCPYDFKNIQFQRVDANTITVIHSQYYNDYSANIESFFNSTKNTVPFKYQYLRWLTSSQAVQEGFSDFLGMTNEQIISSGLYYCMLDYKSFDPEPGLLASVTSITDNNSKWLYTFSTTTFTDSSLNGYANNVFSNKVGVYLSGPVMFLSHTCFIGNNCYSNTFGNDCYGNTFGNSCYFNTFGNSCYGNTFGNDYYYNTFGNDCSSNAFGNYCHYNTFGNYCNSNTFGDQCYSNTFGGNSYHNTFGDSCWSNTFGNYCDSNTFGYDCDYNTFGNYCDYNTFGNDCDYNTFGNSCDSNTFGNYCRYNTFGNSCLSNTFGNYLQESHFGDGVQNFSITSANITTEPTSSNLKSYIRWLIVENGVRYANPFVTASTSSSSYCQNVRICQGCSGTSNTRKSFLINNVNASKQIIVCPNSSGTLKSGNLGDLFK